MTCTFAKDFIAKHAQAFFQDETLRAELTKHLLACADCQEHINTNVGSVLKKIKANPEGLQPILEKVINVAEDDLAKWKNGTPYAQGKKAGKEWPKEPSYRSPTHEDCPFPKDSQQSVDYWDGFMVGYMEVVNKQPT